MDRQLIEQFVAEAPELGKSIAGLSREDLLAFPVPNTWSIQQIVIHVVDSDLILGDRMKRVIAEDDPKFFNVDESRYARDLHYEAQDVAIANDLFIKNRQMMAAILRRLPDEAFQRSGTHSTRGRMTLLDLLTAARNHLPHHMKFICEKRQLLGKTLKG